MCPRVPNHCYFLSSLPWPRREILINGNCRSCSNRISDLHDTELPQSLMAVLIPIPYGELYFWCPVSQGHIPHHTWRNHPQTSTPEELELLRKLLLGIFHCCWFTVGIAPVGKGAYAAMSTALLGISGNETSWEGAIRTISDQEVKTLQWGNVSWIL